MESTLFTWVLFGINGVLIPLLFLIMFFTRTFRTQISMVAGSVSLMCWLVGGILSVYWLSFGFDVLFKQDAVRMGQFLSVFPTLFWYTTCLLLSWEFFQAWNWAGAKLKGLAKKVWSSKPSKS